MDDIHFIQTDDSDVSDKDRYVINTIFNSKKVVKSYHFKQIFIISLLFCILSLPMMDYYIEMITKVKNVYYKLSIKTFLFFSFYFLIINYIVKN